MNCAVLYIEIQELGLSSHRNSCVRYRIHIHPRPRSSHKVTKPAPVCNGLPYAMRVVARMRSARTFVSGPPPVT